MPAAHLIDTALVEAGRHDGPMVRPPSIIRDWISSDGSTGFPAEPGRYNLYVS